MVPRSRKNWTRRCTSPSGALAPELIPTTLIVARYFAKQQEAITRLEADLEAASAKVAELEEEHGGEDGAFSELDLGTLPTDLAWGFSGWGRKKPEEN